MGRTQIGLLYIRYRSNSVKTKRVNAKAYKLHPFRILSLNLLKKFCYLLLRLKKPNMKNWILLIFFLFCPPISITQKLYCVCKYYTYQMTALLPGIFLFWFGVMYKLWLASYSHKIVFEDVLHIQSSTSGALVQLFCVRHVESSHTLTTEHVQLIVHVHEYISRILTIVFLIYLALKTNSGQPKTLLCI